MSDVKTTELILNKMDEYMVAAQGVIEQYGGDVAELGLNVLRVEVLSILIPSLILAIVFGVLAKKLYTYSISKGTTIKAEVLKAALSVAYHNRHSEQDRIVKSYTGTHSSNVDPYPIDKLDTITDVPNPNTWDDFRIMWSLFAATSVVIGTVFAYKLLNIWLWVGLVYPEMYAVHKFILN